MGFNPFGRKNRRKSDIFFALGGLAVIASLLIWAFR